MVLPVIEGTFRCALNWRHDDTGQTACNVIHLRTGLADADGVALAIMHVYDPLMYGFTVDTAHIESIVVQPLDGTSAAFEGVPYYDMVGSAGGGSGFVPDASVVVRFGTVSAGRSHRGRAFLPFISESAMENGLITGDTTTVSDAWVGFQENLALDAAEAEQVVASYKLSTAQQVVSYRCEPVLGTQRRRQGRLR